MIRRGVALMVVLGVANVAGAANVIREWGGHSAADYRIDTHPVLGDIGVRIRANTQPMLPWKFEAYDGFTQAPGHIDYIWIDSGVPVANIKLSVIGDPRDHEHGAQDLDLLDLVEHGASSNILQVIDIAGDCGADGEMRAYGADSITIGGDLGPSGIHILGPLTGDIRVGGFGPHTGSLVIDASAAGYGPSIYFGGTMNGNIEFGQSWNVPIEVIGDLGGTITVAQDMDYPGGLTANNILDGGGVKIARDLLNGSVVLPYSMSKLGGLFRIGRDMRLGGWLVCSYVTATGRVEIEGDADGMLSVGTVRSGGVIQIRGGIDGTLWTDNLHGAVTVGGDLSGHLLCQGHVSGSIVTHGLSGLFRAPCEWDREYRMTGSLTVDGDACGEIAVTQLEADGLIDVTGDLSGAIDIGAADVGVLDGTVQVRGAMPGTIDVVADLGQSGSIEVGAYSSEDVAGTIAIHGDLAGGVHLFNGLVDPLGGRTGGQITVHGCFVGYQDIEINGLLEGTTTFVTIDFDGYDSGDDWLWPAEVCVGDPPTCYTENTPGQRIYEVTCQKGDANNDSGVNNADVNLFTQALEGASSYCWEVPGLCGSMLVSHRYGLQRRDRGRGGLGRVRAAPERPAQLLRPVPRM